MVTLTCTPVSGWFWWTAQTHATAKGKPVDSQCVAHGEAGRCDFYKCFEDRLPCGEQGYMIKYGQPYCARFERVYTAFSPQGQDFINGTSQCLTRGLLHLYRTDTVDCHRLSHDAFDLISSCYSANGFCDVVKENAAVFADVFQARHLFMHGALKIWKEIMEIIYQCNPDQIHKFASFAIGISNRLWNSGDSSGHS
ncbi:uncharacterized protein LOC112560798 [Pomacea canaliculata]|uniref:uncharacterized protein LOC112560798 n=1 Tax=Pomacea canaliculata TaxID=400727 RepID=UPI000D731A31|nr:uncharacterized protein LOC112560798 [Pomacea canaliculata]